MNEIWKDIPGYEGKYQASSEGRIRSLTRKVRGICHFTGREFQRTVQGRILKPGKYCKAGHVSVVLGHGTNGIPVHQLIARTFLGECPLGNEVLHNNGHSKDNRVENLRYGTRSENILDVYNDGGRWRKLSIKDVYDIRFRFLCGYRGYEIAELYGVSQTTVSNIKTRRIYGWLE
ncbi:MULTISPECIES: NUMOD4 motif-containing HNH endonuclease [Bacillota]|uniref:NUMOD4 motif-containing HNH endonuclease n=1 Tax=Anaerococcus degeneri TaxID=361500 RepID=A0ABS7YV37_9FIRM|nr:MULTISPECIES: NUMOD4 motif-containing HNH endonuclease [Bacillota]HEN4473686.1 NUMOD4 motif-containing HNH endonuclease [Streptococcus agalactiae]MBP2015843.1 hypothetical protein [Anaerococcus degeneri]MCA2095595.1 NUMOD4 motif-containing HNH endonuclease [Anaerococcus degeneri]CCQ82075.1 hypothetical protein GBS1014_0578 [Streptococcus agalactiae SS1014]VTT15048.1 prophage LambdaSa2, HNH endonuclease family protein [Streptococcus dysgalactiae subsp. equisimilis]